MPEATPTVFQRGQRVERRGYDEAARGVAVGLGQLAQIPGLADRRAFVRGFFEHLAEGDRHVALEAVRRKGLSDEESDVALRTLVESWQTGPADPDVTRDLNERFGPRMSILAPLLSGSSPDYASALEVGRGVMGDRQWIDFLSYVAGREAQTNPRAAFDLGANLDGDTQTYFLQTMTAGWAAAKPEAAFNWATQIADPDLRGQLQANALASWAQQDPAASAAHLLNLAPGPARDQAIKAIGAAWGAADTQAALTWAANLPDAAQQQMALAGIRTSAPSGIGLTLLAGVAGGYPQVGDMIAGGAAAETGGFAEGDRIAAISDANGQMIDVRGKPLSEVVGMIRGAPGTSVQIAVLPANGEGPGDWRIVTVPRRQLMMKR
jgi:hypothetical protein